MHVCYRRLSDTQSGCAAAGAMIVSPSGVASVCSGDQLELRCTTSGSLLKWAFILTPDNAVARAYTKGLTTTTEAPEPLGNQLDQVHFFKILSTE